MSLLSLKTITLSCEDGKPVIKANLEDYWRSRLDLEYSSVPEWVEGRVGVVCKRSSVEDEDRGDVVQDEAELVRMKACLGRLTLRVDDGRSEAGHGGVVYNSAHLKEKRKG